jgi:hypothetical protein
MTIEFNIERGKLQHLFKHAVDFGITGHWNNQTAETFEETIHNHINNPQVETIEGTYRGIVEVTHFFDPTTNLCRVSKNAVFGLNLLPGFWTRQYRS